jgi:hypothetical protein
MRMNAIATPQIAARGDLNLVDGPDMVHFLSSGIGLMMFDTNAIAGQARTTISQTCKGTTRGEVNRTITFNIVMAITAVACGSFVLNAARILLSI